MYLNLFFGKLIKLVLLFAIFSVVMIIKNHGTKVRYGKIILAIILPVLVEFVKLFEIYFSFNTIVLMACQIVLWLLQCFVWLLAFLMIYKATTNSSDGMVTIFKRDFKGWNIAVLVAIVLGVCSIVGQAWYMIEYGDEYAQMIEDALNSANYLSLMSGMDFNTLYDRLVDLNVVLKWVITACIIIPAVVHGKVRIEASEE